ncbi:hypothetical protein GM921_08425 [Pedobacter sp. LMG 31464]|uniref:Uncharacterized protein n=1 Tax=Pedobacter planticolens TaxID=2679964 RepID=A0A923DZK3_9SPHI|nr:hypothetical protein [Pedobacter planticolens]MBB2145505.1 hypothetical protein [Pedobacter planticolens]
MHNKKQTLLIIVIVLVIIGWIMKDTFTQSSIEDLKGGFTEIASYRNENNTGPVQRIYAVTVKDTTSAQLVDYGNLKPHTKYGNTKVYFFLEGSNVPSNISPGDVNFDAMYNSSCFALYEKSAMGNFGLVKNPFK